MSLHFQENEDAVFIGLEAEGPYIGMPTVFVVGQPAKEFIVRALDYASEIYKNGFGLYIGAGGNLDNLLHPANLDAVLKDFHKLELIQRIAIESFVDRMVAFEANYTGVVNFWLPKTKIRDWILPVIWNTPRDVEFFESVQRNKTALQRSPFLFFVKVYIEKQVLFTAPLFSIVFADYDNNKGNFNTDVLFYSSVKGKVLNEFA